MCPLWCFCLLVFVSFILYVDAVGVDLVRIPPASLVADVIPKVSYYSLFCKNIRNLNVIKTFSTYIFVMPRKTRLPACSVQPTEQVTSPRADPPRRVLRSRQGQAGVIMNLGEGSTSFIVALGQAPAASFSLSRCKDKRCKTCPTFLLSKIVKSNVTNRTYDMINHTTENLNCHTQNIVYLCTCLSCGVQYVGETVQEFHERINGHRTAKQGCEHEIRHCKEACNGYQFQFQILEKLPGTGYNSSGEVDPEMLKLRKSQEDE